MIGDVVATGANAPRNAGPEPDEDLETSPSLRDGRQTEAHGKTGTYQAPSSSVGLQRVGACEVERNLPRSRDPERGFPASRSRSVF